MSLAYSIQNICTALSKKIPEMVDNDDDADIINDDGEGNVDGEELALHRRYHAYVAYHPDIEDWVD